MVGEGKEGDSSDLWMSVLAVKNSPFMLPRNDSALAAFSYHLVQDKLLRASLS